MKTVILTQKIAAMVMLLSLMSCMSWPRSEKWFREHSDILLGQPDLGAGKLPLIYSDSGAYILTVNGETVIREIYRFKTDGTVYSRGRNAGLYRTDGDTIFANIYISPSAPVDINKIKLLYIDPHTLRILHQSWPKEDYDKNEYFLRYYDFGHKVKRNINLNKFFSHRWIWGNDSLYLEWKND